MARNILWEPVKYDYDKLKQKWMNVDEEDEYMDDIQELNPEEFVVGKMVTTPFGLFEVSEAFNPLNHFEFWIGHTNFDITPEFVNIVNSIPGVEGLKIFSRYRFIITIGKLFNFTQVRSLLELALGTLALSDEILNLKDELDQEDKEWYMYVYPDLKTFTLAKAGEDDYEDNIKEILELTEKGTGFLLSSEGAI